MAPPRNRRDASATGESQGLGHLPAIALIAALGMTACVGANALSRSTSLTSTIPYWLGLLVIVLPIFYRLCALRPSFGERFGLVALLALVLYGVKVGRDALVYTFSDEPVHAFNAQQIVTQHHLFHANPILGVTPDYPGLEGATSALMTLTGMSSFGAGTILIGAARLTFVLALFILFTRLSRSPRLAGIGVAIYTGSSNFVFWGAQFSYESLSLPLLALTLMALAEWGAAPDRTRRGWAVVIVATTLAIVVTHHLTSYALALFLVALAVVTRLMGVPRPNPWRFAAVAAVGATAWLLIVADSTIGYLFPVISDAFKATISTASGGEPPRGLFHPSSTEIVATPPAARVVALTAVALLVLGFAVGGVRVLKRHRREPFTMVLAVAGAAFFAALALRFAPAAWETGNRAGEFLFIGLALVAAYGALRWLGPTESSRRRRLVLAGCLGVLIVGGAISGWPWDAQLAQPLKASASGGTIVSEPLALGEWAGEDLRGRRFAAPSADARMLLEPGRGFAKAGSSPNIEDLLESPALEGWQLPLLREYGLRYVVADRRKVSNDAVRGYFFEVPGRGDRSLRVVEAGDKFAKLPVGRVYDSGRIVVYDLEDRP